MPQNPQDTIIKTALKYYNELINTRTKSIRWIKMTTDTGIKFIVETSDKERYQQLLDFITIYVLKIYQQHPSSHNIITLTTNIIINSSFNKHPMPWYIIHRLILHPYDSFMKDM